jgi:hypothetical protein
MSCLMRGSPLPLGGLTAGVRVELLEQGCGVCRLHTCEPACVTRLVVT